MELLLIIVGAVAAASFIISLVTIACVNSLQDGIKAEKYKAKAERAQIQSYRDIDSVYNPESMETRVSRIEAEQRYMK